MLNWRRIIIGDAFQLYSRDFNYYRDLALFWPFLLFSIVAFSEFYARTTTQGHRIAMLAIAIACLILAKEKLLLIAVSMGFVALRCVWAFVTGTRGLSLFVAFVATGGLTAFITFARKSTPMSYEYSKRTGAVDLVVGLGSLVGTIALKIWLDKVLT
jgi:hypothetical protein